MALAVCGQQHFRHALHFETNTSSVVLSSKHFGVSYRLYAPLSPRIPLSSLNLQHLTSTLILFTFYIEH